MSEKQDEYLEELIPIGTFFVTKDKRYKIEDLSEIPRLSNKEGEQSEQLIKKLIEEATLKENQDKSPRSKLAHELKDTELSALQWEDIDIDPQQVMWFNYESQVGNYPSHRMHTIGQFNNQDGWVYATTRTRTTTALGGYHGGVSIVILNQNYQTIFATNPWDHRWGVDGYWIGRNDRTDAWRHQIPPQIAQQAAYVSLVHTWVPNSLWTILQRAYQVLKLIFAVWGEINRNESTPSGLYR